MGNLVRFSTEAELEVKRLVEAVLKTKLAEEAKEDKQIIDKLEIEEDEMTDDTERAKVTEEPLVCGACGFKLEEDVKKCPNCKVEFEE